MYQKARERNIFAGLIILDLIAFISFVIFTYGIVYYGDIQILIGCFVGTRFTVKNVKPNQSFYIHGLVVSLGGSILAAISFTMFDWVYFLDPISDLIIIFVAYLIEAIIIGLLVGSILATYYNYKRKRHVELSSKDQELLKSLIDQ
ncbi:MAG: hypothetical protein ACFFDF_04275 [Candidatus Odinarchaeota archaeon]